MVIKREKITFRVSARDIYKKNKSLVLLSGFMFLLILGLALFVNALNESDNALVINSSLSAPENLEDSSLSLANNTALSRNILLEEKLPKILPGLSKETSDQVKAILLNTSIDPSSASKKIKELVNKERGIDSSSQNTPNSPESTKTLSTEGYFEIQSTPGKISSCQTLNTAGVYTINATKLNSTGTCFTISANNILLNGNGSVITYNTGNTTNNYGIYITSAVSTNITINNITLNSTGGYGSSGNHAVYVESSLSNSAFTNINITLNAFSNALISNIGISIVGTSTNNRFYNNSIKVYSVIQSDTDDSSTYGIYLQDSSSSNDIFINNSFNITSERPFMASGSWVSDYSYGLYISGGTNETLLFNRINASANVISSPGGPSWIQPFSRGVYSPNGLTISNITSNTINARSLIYNITNINWYQSYAYGIVSEGWGTSSTTIFNNSVNVFGNVTNCSGSWVYSYNYGIFIGYYASDFSVYNNTLNIIGKMNNNTGDYYNYNLYGISTNEYLSNNNFTGNIINAIGNVTPYDSGSYSVAHALDFADLGANNLINNNKISSTSSGGDYFDNSGVIVRYPYQGANNNIFSNNTIYISCIGGSTWSGTYCYGLNFNIDPSMYGTAYFENNFIVNNTVFTNVSLTSGSYSSSPIYVYLASGSSFKNNIFQNNTLSSSGSSDTTIPVNVFYVSGAGSFTNLTFINTGPGNFSFGQTGGTIIVKDLDYGEIRFKTAITDGYNNFNRQVNVSNNSAYVNISEPGLNQLADVLLYNLTFPNTPYSRIFGGSGFCSLYCSTWTALTSRNYKFTIYDWNEGPYSLVSLGTYSLGIFSYSPINVFNTSNTSSNFIFRYNYTLPGTLNCSLYVDSTLKAANNSVLNNTSTNFSVPGITGGLHYWNVTCSDSFGVISNISETRNFYVDIYPPTVSNILYSPDNSDDIDPQTNLTFNAIVSDDRVSVSKVLFEYYNGTSWSNSTMILINSTNHLYQTNITTIPIDARYDFNIWANDSFNNLNKTINESINSSWDCTWTVSPSDTPQFAGWDQNKFVFNLTINNTGDPEFAANNCTLNFHLTHNLDYGRIYFNDWSNNLLNNYYDTSAVPAKSSVNITINSTFRNQILEEQLKITVQDFFRYSSVPSLNSTETIISTSGGPYLYQKIETNFPSYIYLTPQNMSVSSYLRNIPADGTENTTAYNVSFNWSLPNGFLVSAGEANISIENLSNNSLEYNDINLTFNETNLGYITPQIVSVYLYAQGYNSSSDLIIYSGNRTLLTQQANITLLCYNETDGFCVPNCGYSKDPDCVEPSSSTGGGGGGGGAGNNGKEEQSSATFELLSGKQQVFQLPIENKYADPKENIRISVSGINSEYIKISPDTIARIDPRSSKNITVTITAPAYFSKGEYKLTFTIVGELNSNKTKELLTERKLVTLNIVELPKEDTDILINDSLKIIAEMNSSKMVLTEVLGLYAEIKTAYSKMDYAIVKNNYEKIKEIRNAAFDSQAIIKELNDKIKQAEKDGISVLETKKIFYTSQSAFERGDYGLALSRLNEAKLTFAIETKGEFNLLYVVKNNPIKSGVSIIGFALFAVAASVALRLSLYKKKLKALTEEEKLLLELMKVIQRECFTNNHMSMEEYEQAMSQYETRLSKAIEEKIEAEAKIANLMKIKGKKRALEDERNRLVSLVRKIQDDYMNKGIIETRIYENMIKSYSGRLAEVEEELTFFDAQEALSQNKWSRRILKVIGIR